MSENDSKLDALNKVLQSKEFQSSKTKKKLLTFLVDSAIHHREVKEFTIASEVFDKKDFDPAADASIRVYISTLRKKLEDYYREEGAGDKIRILLPKGHHDVVFVDSASEPIVDRKPVEKKMQFVLWGAATVILALAALLVAILVNTRNGNYSHDLVWKEFNSSSLPKTLILGNDLFFLHGDAENETIMRKHFINSPSAFETFKSNTGDEKVKQITPYPFFPILSVAPLPVIFQKADLRGCTLLPSSRVVANDLLASDILFVGSFRNLYLLERLLNDRYLTFSLVQDSISITIAANDSTRTLKLLGTPELAHSDLCLLRKIPGPKNNTIILFATFFHTGIRATMDFVGNPDNVKGLEEMFTQKVGHVPRYFDVLFRVSGYSRTAYKINVEHLHAIDPQTLKIWEYAPADSSSNP
jgi:hypothetical protein